MPAALIPIAASVAGSAVGSALNGGGGSGNTGGQSDGSYQYIPMYQQQADQSLYQQMQALAGANPYSPANTGQYVNAVQQQLQSPYASGYQGSASNAGSVYNQLAAATGAAPGGLGAALNNAGASNPYAANYINDPSAYASASAWDQTLAQQSAQGYAQQNIPYYQGMAADSGQTGNNLGGLSQQLAGLFPQYQQYGQQLAQQGFQANPENAGAMDAARSAGSLYQQVGQGQIGQANNLYGLEGQIQQTAFDPQNALYGRTLNQTQQQQNAQLAQMGLSSSAAGAGIADQNLQNFNIDWQNNQLSRQIQGTSAINSLASTGGALATTGANNYNLGSQLPYQTQNSILQNDQGRAVAGVQGATNAFNSGAGALTQAGNLGQTGLADRTSGVSGILQQIQAALAGGGGYSQDPGLAQLAANSAGSSSAYGNSLGVQNNSINTAGQLSSLGAQGANYALQGGATPYNTSLGMTNDQLQLLLGQYGIGQQNYQDLIQALNPYQAYLGMGQTGNVNAQNAYAQQQQRQQQGASGGSFIGNQLGTALQGFLPGSGGATAGTLPQYLPGVNQYSGQPLVGNGVGDGGY